MLICICICLCICICFFICISICIFLYLFNFTSYWCGRSQEVRGGGRIGFELRFATERNGIGLHGIAQIIGIDYPRSCIEDADKFRDSGLILNPKLLGKAQEEQKRLNSLQKHPPNNCQPKTARKSHQICDKVLIFLIFDTKQQL